MSVVAAGVHRALVLRGKRQPGRFLDRQRVHVGAEGHGRPRLRAANQRHDAMAGHASPHLVDPHRPQLFGHDPRRPLFPIGEFRMHVEIPPPLDHRRRDLAAQFPDSLLQVLARNRRPAVRQHGNSYQHGNKRSHGTTPGCDLRCTFV